MSFLKPETFCHPDRSFGTYAVEFSTGELRDVGSRPSAERAPEGT